MKSMYKKADEFTKAHIVPVQDDKSLKAALDGGNFADAYWCGDEACELGIKHDHAATARVMHEDQSEVSKHKCVRCGKDAKYRIYFARAY